MQTLRMSTITLKFDEDIELETLNFVGINTLDEVLKKYNNLKDFKRYCGAININFMAPNFYFRIEDFNDNYFNNTLNVLIDSVTKGIACKLKNRNITIIYDGVTNEIKFVFNSKNNGNSGCKFIYCLPADECINTFELLYNFYEVYKNNL